MRKLMICLSFSGLAFGCSEEEQENPYAVNSGLEAGRTISSLGEGEVQTFCEALQQKESAVVGPAAACSYLVVGGDTPAECQANQSYCLELIGDTADNTTCLLSNAPKRAECTATVGQLEACLSEVISIRADVLEQARCENAGNPELLGELIARLPNDLEQVASCNLMLDQCTSLLGPRAADR